jgi:hypothetical protein
MTNKLTLGDLEGFDSTEKTYPALIGGNMGHVTLKLNLSIHEVIERARVYNAQTVEELGKKASDNLDAQRPLYEKHAKDLAKYIVIGLVETNIRRIKRSGGSVSKRVLNLQKQLGHSPYSCLQPFVTNIRDCRPDGSDLQVERIEEKTKSGAIQQLDGVIKVIFTSKHIMSVVDGQHRRYAFDLVMKWLGDINSFRKYPTKGVFNPEDTFTYGDKLDKEVFDFWLEILDIAIKEAFVSVECHLGATAAEERQIFSDLNSKGKKVELSQSLEYDTSDAVNSFIKKELIAGKVLNFDTKMKDSSNWQDDDGKLLRKDLNQISALAMFGKGSTKGVTPAMVGANKGIAIKFWNVVQKIPNFGAPKSRLKTVAAQPVILKAIARLAFELAYGKGGMQSVINLTKLWDAIEKGKIDFSHKNLLWRTLMLNPQEREKLLHGVSKYVHVPQGTNLDAGTYDDINKWVRFNSKHNDIYPRLADLIRYELKFDHRPSVTRSIKKELEVTKP